MSQPLLHRVREGVRPLVPRRLRVAVNRLVFGLIGLALTGSAVRCTCCGRSYRRFVDYPSAYCPGCGAYERQRLLCLYLDRHPELVRGDVLHVGPEACVMARYRAGSRSWLAADVDPGHPLVERVTDVTKLALPDAAFDLVLCSHVLDVVGDHDQAVRELARVTRLGGTVLIQAPRRAVRGSPDSYAARLGASGLDVSVVTLPEQEDEPTRRRLGLDDDEPIFVGRRSH
ncbi:MAG TPA: methyltransferase domain-containing protein [Gaiellaceae bacterium]|nr:methyltransferase domain-containing protein [Gaiellaceae bacterium]